MNQTSSNILLIEDNPGDARLVQILLAEAGDGKYPVVTADRLAPGLERLEAGGIDLVLLDLFLPDSHGIETFHAVKKRAPQLPIIVLSGLEDETIAVRAVEEGAQDFLPKARVDGGGLARAMRYAIARHSAHTKGNGQRQKGRVLAFLGVKGGVGTTTVALNVGAVCANMREKVVAVELRPDPGSFSFFLRESPPKNLSHLTGLAAEQIRPAEVEELLYHSASGLVVLFGPQKAAQCREIKSAQVGPLIQALAGMADHVIIDLPSQWSEASQAAIQVSEFLALVLEPEPVSMLAAARTLELLEATSAAGIAKGAVIVNRPALYSPITQEEISARLGFPVVGIVPPAGDAMAKAHRDGALITVSDPESLVASSLIQVAGKLTRKTDRLVSQPVRI